MKNIYYYNKYIVIFETLDYLYIRVMKINT